MKDHPSITPALIETLAKHPDKMSVVDFSSRLVDMIMERSKQFVDFNTENPSKQDYANAAALAMIGASAVFELKG